MVVDGCSGQRLRLALAQIEMELRAEQSLSIMKAITYYGIGWMMAMTMILFCSEPSHLFLKTFLKSGEGDGNVVLLSKRC